MRLSRVTYDVDDLLEREAEFEDEGLRLVGDGPLEVVVLLHEVVDQSPLVWTAPHACNKKEKIRSVVRALLPSSENNRYLVYDMSYSEARSLRLVSGAHNSF